MKVKPKLTPRQQHFVAEVIKGKTKTAAYEAVYKPKTQNRNSIHRQANEVSRNHLVQEAIEQAMEANEMTPEYLVRELKNVIEQEKEIGAKRLAIKDGLELLGWQRGQRPTITLDMRNASFFSKPREEDTV